MKTGRVWIGYPSVFLLAVILCGCAETGAGSGGKGSSAQDEKSDRVYISGSDLRKAISQGEKITILDVRTRREYRSGHVPGAVLLPYDRVVAAPNDVPGKDSKMIVVYCEIGARSALARRALVQAGFSNVLQLNGDMAAWRADGLPIEKPK
jgi:rhodanese-related sulfurtransferase